MTINDVINKLIDNWKSALTNDYVRKPLSFALYETWKWANRNETVRNEKDDLVREKIDAEERGL